MTNNVKFAANSLFMKSVDALQIATLNENESVIQEIASFLSSNYSENSILGKALKNRFTLEDLKRSNLSESVMRVGVDRIRQSAMRTPYSAIIRAYEVALKESSSFIEEIPEPTIFDKLYSSWSSDDIAGALELENVWLSEPFDEEENPLSEEEIDADMMPLVYEQAQEILESILVHDLGEDQRQIDLIKYWANINENKKEDGYLIMAKNLLNEARTSLKYHFNSTIPERSTLAKESCAIAESLLQGKIDPESKNGITNILLILEAERTLRITNSDI